jgi:hypothetical protein
LAPDARVQRWQVRVEGIYHWLFQGLYLTRRGTLPNFQSRHHTPGGAPRCCHPARGDRWITANGFRRSRPIGHATSHRCAGLSSRAGSSSSPRLQMTTNPLQRTRGQSVFPRGLTCRIRGTIPLAD